jgi:hypothetical protein
MFLIESLNARRLFFALYFVTLVVRLVSFSAIARAQEWQEIKSEHFVVSFQEDERAAKEILRKSEVYYRQIASELGYQRYSGFWTWDNRVKLYIYPGRDAFQKATGQPHWSEGLADYTAKEIISYAWSEGFTDALLPHEMAHLIFRDYVGFKGEVPLWLDEGVAQWMEPRKREAVKAAVAALEAQGKLLSLPRMMRLDIRQSADKELVNTFYIQAVSVVEFLITRYSAARFTSFCRQLRDGKSIDDSLAFAYPTVIRNISELEDRWRTYIKEEGHDGK